MRASFVSAIGLVLVLASGCGGPGARSPRTSSRLADGYAAILEGEAVGSQEEARAAYLRLAADAVAAPDDAASVPALAAALDALTQRYVAGLADMTVRGALIDRTSGERSRPEAQRLAPTLAKLHEKAASPTAKHFLARALQTLAEDDGNAEEAARWRKATGCVDEVAVRGPVSWTLLSGVRRVGPVALALGEEAPPFPIAQGPVVVRGRGCAVMPLAATSLAGVHEVSVVATVPSAQRITVMLRARNEASVLVGGEPVIHRPYELGAGDVLRSVVVPVEKGALTVVVRAGIADDGSTIALALLDEKGRPLPTSPASAEPGATKPKAAPPKTSSKAAPSTAVQAIAYDAPRSDAERALAGAFALASGDSTSAERLLSLAARAPKASPALALLYARAVDGAFDLPAVDRSARARTAYERVLEAWPGAWEALLGHAVLEGARRGPSEARLERLRDLDARRAAASEAVTPILDAFDAAQSGLSELPDRAAQALTRVKVRQSAAPLTLYTERVAMQREGDAKVAFACNEAPPRSRASFSCYDALRGTGAVAPSLAELQRLRTLFGLPGAYLGAEVRDRLGSGDMEGARKAFTLFLPAEQNLSTLYALGERIGPQAAPAALTAAYDALALTARDAPQALGPLLRAQGEDPLAAFGQLAEERVREDRRAPILSDAATAILAHEERYSVSERGLLHGVVFDLRRVTGTTDVEQNAQAEAPYVEGRASVRTLRRRIFKKDGRILTPERTPGAQQAHADLSQLEAGDAVETAFEVWALPGETGDLTLDTPDLLPERVAVHEAHVEVRLPEKLTAPLAAHALLGKAEERKEGGQRVLRWSLQNAHTRRIEAGTPKMDGAVAVSLSTARWADFGLALRETLQALDEHSPEVDAWAKGLAGSGQPAGAEVLGRVLDGIGEVIKEAMPSDLTDAALGRPRGTQTYTARTMLATHQGSRTWLVVRALRALGIDADVVVAESEPFSADPAFPVHFGRFSHPLAFVHLPAAGKAPAKDVWVDADVPGAPLPPGHLTPSIQGRAGVREDGSFVTLPRSSADEADDLALDLAVDAKGDAKGTFVATLRGREAQDLGDAFARVVGFERQRALTNVVLGWVPYATVDEVNLASSPESWEVVVKAKIRVAGFGDREGEKGLWIPGIDPLHYVYPQPWTFTLGATFAGQGGRTSALAVNDAQRYRLRRRIALPAGATFDRVPKAVDEHAGALEAKRSAEAKGPLLEDEFRLDLSTGTVQAKDYAAFVGAAHRADDAFIARARARLP